MTVHTLTTVEYRTNTVIFLHFIDEGTDKIRVYGRVPLNRHVDKYMTRDAARKLYVYNKTRVSPPWTECSMLPKK